MASKNKVHPMPPTQRRPMPPTPKTAIQPGQARAASLQLNLRQSTALRHGFRQSSLPQHLLTPAHRASSLVQGMAFRDSLASVGDGGFPAMGSGKNTPVHARRASNAWLMNVKKISATGPAQKAARVFRDKQRQLSLKQGADCSCVQDLRNKIQVVALSNWFDGVLTALIVANVIIVILAVDTQAECLNTETVKECLVYESDGPSTFDQFEAMRSLHYADLVFTMLFCLEVLIKMFSFGRAFWNFRWNVFDFTVVTLSVVEAGVSLSVVSSTSPDSTLLAAVPALRTFRVLRILRIFRLVNMFADLSILFKSAAYSARPALWVIFLAALITYIFAIMSTRLFGHADPATAINHAKLAEWFGTVPRSAYTLFQLMTLESWSMGIVRIVMEDFYWAPAIFVTWIVIMTIGVLNLLAAVFVNSYMVCSSQIAEELDTANSKSTVTKVQELKKLLQCNSNEFLSQTQFIERVSQSYELADALRDLVSAERVARAFQCIDVLDTNGKASFDDLFQIALSLEDNATKEDAHHTWLLLAHYISALINKIAHMEHDITDYQTNQLAAAARNGHDIPGFDQQQALQLVQQAVHTIVSWTPDRGAQLLRQLAVVHNLGIDGNAPVDPEAISRLGASIFEKRSVYMAQVSEQESRARAIPTRRRTCAAPMFATSEASDGEL